MCFNGIERPFPQDRPERAPGVTVGHVRGLPCPVGDVETSWGRLWGHGRQAPPLCRLGRRAVPSAGPSCCPWVLVPGSWGQGGLTGASTCCF